MNIVPIDFVTLLTRIAQALERIADNTAKTSDETGKQVEGFKTGDKP